MAGALLADNPQFNSAHFLSVVRGEKELTSRPPRGAMASAKQADWKDDPEFPNWQQEVANGNTQLGFNEWLEHMIEAGNISVPELPVQPAPRSRPNLADIKLPHESSRKARLAGAKLADSITPELANQARELIELDDPIIYDVAADIGQIVGNVAHMSWFVRAVAEWLAEDPTYYAEATAPVSAWQEYAPSAAPSMS